MNIADLDSIRVIVTDIEERLDEAIENIGSPPTDGFTEFVRGALTTCQVSCALIRKACNRIQLSGQRWPVKGKDEY